MLRFRIVILSLCLMTVAATSAFAGHQADYSMSISMDESALGGMASMFGATDEAAPEMPDELSSGMSIVHGKVYWQDGFTRVDMFYDPEMAAMGETEGLQAGDLVESFIMFEESGQTYQLFHGERRAVLFDGSSYSDEMFGDDPMPDMQPDRMIRDYESMINDLQTTEGMTVSELPAATINGVPVKGVSFIMDIASMMEGMEGMEGMPDLSALGELGAEGGEDLEGMEGLEDLGAMFAGIFAMMGDINGEMWFSEELEVLMRFNMSLMGINTTMELDSIFEWTDDGTTFVVPDDYELITQQEYIDEQMEQFNNIMQDFSLEDGEGYDVMQDGAKISKSSDA